jgi:hypothetical protein
MVGILNMNMAAADDDGVGSQRQTPRQNYASVVPTKREYERDSLWKG